MQPLGGAVFALDGILIGASDTRVPHVVDARGERGVHRARVALARARLGHRRRLGGARRPDRRAARAPRRALRGPALGRRRAGARIARWKVSPSSTRISAARSPPTSSGRSRTSRASRCRSRTTGTSTGSSRSATRAACPNLDALDAIYHWTELIQSSPLAVEVSVHAAIGGAYRSQGITTLELRFNPMKRNRGGERDLDHIILAAIRGLDRASLEYPQVRAGLILMMDRTFTRAAERGDRREGDRLGVARDRRRRHRRPAAGRRALRLPAGAADGRDGARGRASA